MATRGFSRCSEQPGDPLCDHALPGAVQAACDVGDERLSALVDPIRL